MEAGLTDQRDFCGRLTNVPRKKTNEVGLASASIVLSLVQRLVKKGTLKHNSSEDAHVSNMSTFEIDEHLQALMPLNPGGASAPMHNLSSGRWSHKRLAMSG
jgi:hypothetical protein